MNTHGGARVEGLSVSWARAMVLGLVVAAGCAGRQVVETPERACSVSVTRVDGMGAFESQWFYDRSGRLLHADTRRAYAGWTDLDYGYDAKGRLVSSREVSTGPFQREDGRYTYSRRGRLRRVRIDGVRSTSKRYGYARGGRLAWEMRGGRRRVFVYRGGRLSTIKTRIVGNRTRTELAYDAAGRLQTAVFRHCAAMSGSCTEKYRYGFSYDQDSRLSQLVITDPDDGQTSARWWRYDAEGRLIRYGRETSQGGRDVVRWSTYDRDASGRWIGTGGPGGSTSTVRYEGACQAVDVGPRASTPLELVHAVPMVGPERPGGVKGI